jgi:AcrR family transcriptional regulator
MGLDKPRKSKYTLNMETPLPKSNEKQTHWQAREQGHELLRRNVVEAASHLLMEEGPDALTVRHIAQELECSTKIIYTMFHGKEGLAEALYLEGCERLGHLIGGIPRQSTLIVYIHEVAHAYWAFALANPSYYKVMFCGAIPHFHPSTMSILTMETAFEMVVARLRVYKEQGLLQADDSVIVTKVLWASLHGIVSLYLLGHFSDLETAKEVLERSIQALIASLVPRTLLSS